MYRMIYAGGNLDFGKYYEDKLISLTGDEYIGTLFTKCNSFGSDNMNTDIQSTLEDYESFYNDLHEEYKFDIEEFMRYTRAIHTIYYIIDELFYISEYRLVHENDRFYLKCINMRDIPLHAFPERYIYFYCIDIKDSYHCHYGYSFHFKDAYDTIRRFRNKKRAVIFKSSLYHMELPSIYKNHERTKELYYNIESSIPDNPRSYYEYLMDISDGEVYEYDENMNIFIKYFDLNSDSRFMMDDLLDYEFYRKHRYINDDYTLLDYLVSWGMIV